MSAEEWVTTYSIDDQGPYAVVARTYRKRITIQENYDSDNPPTANLRMYHNPASATPAKVPMGTPAIFTKAGRFRPGDIAGYINTVSGTITVAHIESEEI